MNARTWLAGLMLVHMSAFADGFNYSYVEAGYIDTEMDAGPVDIDGDGIEILASYSVAEEFHVFGGYEDLGFDANVDMTTITLGGGMNYVINEDWDVVGRVAYVSADIDTPAGSLDEDGYFLQGGVRGRLSSNLELEAGLEYLDLNSSDTSVFVSARYYLDNGLGLGAGLDLNDGDSKLTLAVRFPLGGGSGR